jgi:hypothetical protein
MEDARTRPARRAPAVTGPESPAQQWRLRRFRSRNPGVVITRDSQLGFWQAWIPAPNGGTLITRHVLPDLLDALEAAESLS